MRHIAKNRRMVGHVLISAVGAAVSSNVLREQSGLETATSAELECISSIVLHYFIKNSTASTKQILQSQPSMTVLGLHIR